MKRNPKERLGFKNKQEIKDHPFFKDIDFEKIYNKEYTPPSAIMD